MATINKANRNLEVCQRQTNSMQAQNMNAIQDRNMTAIQEHRIQQNAVAQSGQSKRNQVVSADIDVELKHSSSKIACIDVLPREREHEISSRASDIRLSNDVRDEGRIISSHLHGYEFHSFVPGSGVCNDQNTSDSTNLTGTKPPLQVFKDNSDNSTQVPIFAARFKAAGRYIAPTVAYSAPAATAATQDNQESLPNVPAASQGEYLEETNIPLGSFARSDFTFCHSNEHGYGEEATLSRVSALRTAQGAKTRKRCVEDGGKHIRDRNLVARHRCSKAVGRPHRRGCARSNPPCLLHRLVGSVHPSGSCLPQPAPARRAAAPSPFPRCVANRSAGPSLHAELTRAAADRLWALGRPAGPGARGATRISAAPRPASAPPTLAGAGPAGHPLLPPAHGGRRRSCGRRRRCVAHADRG